MGAEDSSDTEMCVRNMIRDQEAENNMNKDIPISVCIIAKNEEEHMRVFLESIRKAFKGKPVEIVVLDTGSTDKTRDIAVELADKVADFKWISDFSAARNRSIELASHEWILVLDCDENVVSADFNDLQRFIREEPENIGQLLRHNHYPMNGTDAVYNDRVERFFNRRRFNYTAPIHEQVTPIKDKPYSTRPIDLAVDHSGYNGSEEQLKAKARRNNELLFKMLEDDPENPYLYFQVGQSYNLLDEYEKAAEYFGKGLTFDVDPKLEYVQMMVTAYGYALLKLKRYDEALQFENIYDTFGNTADFLCLMGLIYMRTGRVVSAMEQFLKATTFETSSVEGANSFIPRYNMGVINEVLGDIKDALRLYKACGDFKPATDRLAKFAEAGINEDNAPDGKKDKI
jgi:glycosyltransferase involved in cell wall biosynthesis